MHFQLDAPSVAEEKRGARITQGNKPFLKRGPSSHGGQGSFRRRSIRYSYVNIGVCIPERNEGRRSG